MSIHERLRKEGGEIVDVSILVVSSDVSPLALVSLVPRGEGLAEILLGAEEVDTGATRIRRRLFLSRGELEISTKIQELSVGANKMYTKRCEGVGMCRANEEESIRGFALS